jgi:hypothetical protein
MAEVMSLQRGGKIRPDVKGWAALEFWSDDPQPRCFVVRVSRTYARNRMWDCSAGLEQAVERHRDELLLPAQEAFNEGAEELVLLG